MAAPNELFNYSKTNINATWMNGDPQFQNTEAKRISMQLASIRSQKETFDQNNEELFTKNQKLNLGIVCQNNRIQELQSKIAKERADYDEIIQKSRQDFKKCFDQYEFLYKDMELQMAEKQRLVERERDIKEQCTGLQIVVQSLYDKLSNCVNTVITEQIEAQAVVSMVMSVLADYAEKLEHE